MLRRMRWGSLLGVALLLSWGCETDRGAEPGTAAAPASERTADVQAEEQAIRDLSRQWTEAARARDPDRMSGIYADDAIMYEPGREPVRGRSAIRSHYADTTQLDIREIESEITNIEVAASGDLAYEVGQFRFEAEGPQGRISDRGVYLAVWRKRNGQWQIVHEVSNSSLPTTQAPPRPAT